MDAPASGSNRRAIPATCSMHGGAVGFTNLVVSKLNDSVELDPHVDRSCVITLDVDSARVLFDALGEWLG